MAIQTLCSPNKLQQFPKYETKNINRANHLKNQKQFDGATRIRLDPRKAAIYFMNV